MACGRYVGPVSRCPYCDESTPSQPAIRLVKITALLLATAGLALLWLAAAKDLPPLVRITDISPPMNFAQVRIEGTVAERPRIRHDNNSLSFLVSDGSSRLRVYADGKTAMALAANGKTLLAGSSITVSGSLKVKANGAPILFLRSADHLILHTAPVGEDAR